MISARRVLRKRSAVIGIAAVAALLVTGCGSGSSSSTSSATTQGAATTTGGGDTATTAMSESTTTESGSTGSTSAPSSGASGGNLVVGITADPDTLDPWTATQFQAIGVLQNIYDTLTQFDADLNVVPGLAESWDVSDDGLTVTLNLRAGVKFADGSDLDSGDVKYSLETINTEATAAVARTSLASVTAIDAPDPATVVLTLSAPDAALPSNLAVVNMAIVSSDDSAETLATTPNGSGPFMFDSRTPNQSVMLKRNDSYWGDAAKVDSIEFRIIPDETSIVSAMQSGNVNIAAFDDPLVAQTAESDKITITKTPQLSYHALQLNASKGDLADVNVRLAVQCAISRQEVLDTAALGEGEVTGPITSPAYRSDPNSRPCPERDVDKAKEYLAQAGKADGVTLKTIVMQGGYATAVNEAQSLQSQLDEVGIKLELDVLESSAYVDRWKAGDFDAAVALNGGRPDPDGMYGRYFTSTGNLNSVAGYSSPELDALFAQGRETSDASARKQVYTDISNMLEDNAAWIWLFTSFSYTASTGVQGVAPLANGSLQYLSGVSMG